MKKLLLTTLMLALALPAFALDIPMPDGMKLNMYGQARMAAYYQRLDYANKTQTPDKSDLFYDMQGNSRLGWNFSAGSFKANVELKFVPDQKGDGSLGFRQLWGAYTFDSGLTLTAGNKTTLAGNNGYFNDIYGGDSGLKDYGNIGDVRRPLIMLSYAGFDFAMVTNEKDHVSTYKTETTQELSVIKDKNGNVTDVALVDVETATGEEAKENYIPRFELAYNLKFSNFTGKVFGSYGRFNYEKEFVDVNNNKATKFVGINSWHVGLHANPTFGNMYVKVGAYYGQNVKLDGSSAKGYSHKIVVNTAKTGVNVKNTSSYGAALAFGIKDIVPSLSLEVGGGYAICATEEKDKNNKSLKDQKAYAAYLQTPYKVNQYVIVTPQVGYYTVAYDKADDIDFMAGLQLKVLF